MPPKKRPRSSSGPVGPRMPGGQYYSQSDQAKRDARNARVYRARSSLPTETKYFDTTFSAAGNVDADWATANISCTKYINADGSTVSDYTDCALIPSAIGAGYGQVQGNKYWLQKLRVRGILVPTILQDQADVGNGLTVRLVLVHDTQPNGAQAASSLVFQDLGSAYQCQFSFLAMAAGSGGRFRILHDEIVTLDQMVAGTDGASTNSVGLAGKPFSIMYKPKKPIQVVLKANSSTPAIASLSNNNIYLMAHGAGWAFSVIGAARAYYTD